MIEAYFLEWPADWTVFQDIQVSMCRLKIKKAVRLIGERHHLHEDLLQ